MSKKTSFCYAFVILILFFPALHEGEARGRYGYLVKLDGNNKNQKIFDLRYID